MHCISPLDTDSVFIQCVLMHSVIQSIKDKQYSIDCPVTMQYNMRPNHKMLWNATDLPFNLFFSQTLHTEIFLASQKNVFF